MLTERRPDERLDAFGDWGRFVARCWWLVLLVWLVSWALLRWAAPPWDEVTYDGDLAYLPRDRPSVVGERLLARGFPHDFAASQLVIVIAREDRPLDEEDIYAAYDVARRMKLLHAETALARLYRLERLRKESSRLEAEALAERVELARQEALDAFDEAAYFDEALYRHRQRKADRPAGVVPADAATDRKMARMYWLRAELYEHLGRSEEAERERRRAVAIDPQCPELYGIPAKLTTDWPILDVWTWRDPVFGRKLVSDDKQARLVVLRLANEFMAIRNQPLLQLVRSELQQVRRQLTADQQQHLTIQWTGSAAIGGDMLDLARRSIEHTEWYTVALIVIFLVVVYRAPLLVAIPLVSIALSVAIATHVVALLAVPAEQPWEELRMGLRVFTTTKVFIIVILFGSGTDYCLFLISRYREELSGGRAPREALATTLAGVGTALLASALTTVVGLAMMGLAEFGKFRYSGPVIGLCLLVTLLVCLSFSPALLYALGTTPLPRWLGGLAAADNRNAVSLDRLWNGVSRAVVRYPGALLLLGVVPVLPAAVYGWFSADRVTYDLLAGLPESRPSRIGTSALRRHFPVGESGPVTVVLHQPGTDFSQQQGRQKIYELAAKLYQVPGVQRVRSLVDPLGEYPPGSQIGLTDSQAWRLWLSRPHRKTEAIFVAHTAAYPRDLTRLEVVLAYDPFSPEALRAVTDIRQLCQSLAGDRTSPWFGATVGFAGPTAAMADLREVTLHDRHRIEVLVVAAVLLVLLVLLRRPVICVYLIVSVLFSYLVTIGLTEAVFRWWYGPSYEGLDWKVPLFLFVILVAIGQDYNVYLVTRVFEEQRRRGPVAGLRYAVSRTGGIITSCGLIMAGTFLAMTTPSWAPDLKQWFVATDLDTGTGGFRGLTELGFALTLGIALDTFWVRSVLVPSFLALRMRWRAKWHFRKTDSHRLPKSSTTLPDS